MITDRYMRPSPFAFRLCFSLAPSTNQPADDILRARIQTLGVAEHVFEMNLGRKAVTWRLFDVGYVQPLTLQYQFGLAGRAGRAAALSARSASKTAVEARHHLCRHPGRMYPEILSKP